MELLRWGQEHLLPALRHGSEGKTSAEGEKTSKEQEGVLSETTADFAVACVSVRAECVVDGCVCVCVCV